MAITYNVIKENLEEKNRDVNTLSDLDLLNETIKQLDEDIIKAEKNIWLLDQTKKYYQLNSDKFIGDDIIDRTSKRLYVLIRTKVECCELRKAITRAYIHNMIWNNIGNAKLPN